MARLDRQVVGFERAAALLVDDVESADDPDVVDEVGEVAGPPATIEVVDERRAADGPEDQVRATEDDVPLRVPGVELELDGAVATSASTWAGSSRTLRVEPIDRRAGAGEGVERPVAQDLDADLGQDPKRRLVDGLDVVVRQDLERPERVDQPSPRQLRETRRLAARPPLRTAGRARQLLRRARDRPRRMLRRAGRRAIAARPGRWPPILMAVSGLGALG